MAAWLIVAIASLILHLVRSVYVDTKHMQNNPQQRVDVAYEKRKRLFLRERQYIDALNEDPAFERFSDYIESELNLMKDIRLPNDGEQLL